MSGHTLARQKNFFKVNNKKTQIKSQANLHDFFFCNLEQRRLIYQDFTGTTMK